MRQLTRATMLVAVLLSSAASVSAATPAEFYLSLLRRGVTAFDAQRYPDATSLLKIAAFGFVDSVEQYQTAQVYLALSYERMGDSDRARDAVQRVISAERLERKFATLPLPGSAANAFLEVASKHLGSNETAMLRRTSQPVAPAPQPEKPAAAANPTETQSQPQPASSSPQKPAQLTTSAAQSVPAPQKPPIQVSSNSTTSQPTATPTKPQLTSQEVSSQLAAADRAVTSADLADARRIYRALLGAPSMTRETLMRVAEGLYRSRDFQGSLSAFAKVGALRRGEEPYRYYLAVAYYETGQHERAKEELAAALPYIEATPDVQRYRSMIENAAH